MRVFARLRDQQPGEAGNRISVFPWRIRDGDPEIRGHGLCRGGRGRRAVQARFDEGSRGILHAAVRDLILYSVNQLDVADRTRQLTDGARHALVAFSADAATGPLDGRVAADLIFPFRADLGEVIGEDIGRTATVGTMHDDDGLVRELDVRVGLGDRRVIPIRDLAQEDPGQRFRRELDLARYPRHVVRQNHRSQHRWEMQHLDLGIRQLLIGHRTVAGAKVHHAFGHLANTAAAADRLVVDLHIRVRFTVLAKPFLVNRVGERGARACQFDLAEGGNGKK